MIYPTSRTFCVFLILLRLFKFVNKKMKHHNKKSESCAIKLEINQNNQDQPKSNQEFNKDIEKVIENKKCRLDQI